MENLAEGAKVVFSTADRPDLPVEGVVTQIGNVLVTLAVSPFSGAGEQDRHQYKQGEHSFPLQLVRMKKQALRLASEARDFNGARLPTDPDIDSAKLLKWVRTGKLASSSDLDASSQNPWRIGLHLPAVSPTSTVPGELGSFLAKIEQMGQAVQKRLERLEHGAEKDSQARSSKDGKAKRKKKTKGKGRGVLAGFSGDFSTDSEDSKEKSGKEPWPGLAGLFKDGTDSSGSESLGSEELEDEFGAKPPLPQPRLKPRAAKADAGLAGVDGSGADASVLIQLEMLKLLKELRTKKQISGTESSGDDSQEDKDEGEKASAQSSLG